MWNKFTNFFIEFQSDLEEIRREREYKQKNEYSVTEWVEEGRQMALQQIEYMNKPYKLEMELMEKQIKLLELEILEKKLNLQRLYGDVND